LLPALWLLLATAAALVAAPTPVWVYLGDKPDGHGGRLPWTGPPQAQSVTASDLAVDADYVARVAAVSGPVRTVSRWLNAVSVEADLQAQETLRRLPFVTRVEPVGRRAPAPPVAPLPVPSLPAAVGPAGKAGSLSPVDYGVAAPQLQQVHVDGLHQLGYEGQGIRIAILDDGFHTRHRCFGQLRVVASRDFINRDDDVMDQTQQPVTGDETRTDQNLHGAQVLSLLAGDDAGRFYGVAPRAEYLLAKTEISATELPSEEDRWVAGLEWADSLGAQVVNSSLGYNLWDDGTGYTLAQMDGATAVTTVAAEIAVARGLVVVVAAGNEGGNSWGRVTAPADGPGVISVGAVDIPSPGLRQPLLAYNSSRGPTADGRIKPDVVAPGQGVVVADIRGGDYQRGSGTSFASPLAAGVCALLLQAHPDWTPRQVQAALRRTALDLGPAGPDTAYGWGQVDALAASGLQQPVPEETWAGPPYPNPARGEVVYFPVGLVGDAAVDLRVYEVSGALVYHGHWSLGPGVYASPEQAPQWDLAAHEASRGRRLANGVLLYCLTAGPLEQRGRLALMRSPH
jgi:subtilisin family serine protease